MFRVQGIKRHMAAPADSRYCAILSEQWIFAMRTNVTEKQYKTDFSVKYQ